MRRPLAGRCTPLDHERGVCVRLGPNLPDAERHARQVLHEPRRVDASVEV